MFFKYELLCNNTSFTGRKHFSIKDRLCSSFARINLYSYKNIGMQEGKWCDSQLQCILNKQTSYKNLCSYRDFIQWSVVQKGMALYHLSHPGSIGGAGLNPSLENNAMQQIVIYDTIWHQLSGELTLPLIIYFDVLNQTDSKCKLTICALKNYNLISREKFKPWPGFEPRTSRSLAWHSTIWLSGFNWWYRFILMLLIKFFTYFHMYENSQSLIENGDKTTLKTFSKHTNKWCIALKLTHHMRVGFYENH